MQLSDYTDHALEKELSRRKATRETVPKVNRYPGVKQWSEFANYMQEYANRVAINGHSDDDEHYIYEVACELAFGNVFFDWYNRVVK